MEAFIKQLRDDKENVIYPITKANAVYMPNGVDTVERILRDTYDSNKVIKFSPTSIEQTFETGSSSLVEFKNKAIVETTRDDAGVVVKVKTTTFNDDGSITVEVK